MDEAALTWSGYRLRDLLALADPLPGARFVAVAQGGYVAVLPLQAVEAHDFLLADQGNGQPLSAKTGGLWRLVAPGWPCLYQAKSVERVALVVHDGVQTARAIATRRLGRAFSERLSDRG
ncbi:MAG: molybdopterin-dependent oxidoreductase [Firmicutes bacterium]|nr:molybdopterin-dependent oxidoreductase [Alicyclobacillaceae bacterium]MCL6496736.1 molybdopterin-dependent oxidoreductase [Bacillota bacterium]